MNTKLFTAALLGMTAGLSSHLQAGPGCSGCQKSSELSGKTCGSKCGGEMGAAGALEGQGSCADLSPEEMTFSKGLSESNREAFCGKFSSSQRKEAMQMSCHGPMNCGADRGAGKEVLKPDDAVSKVMKNNPMSMQEKREKAAK